MFGFGKRALPWEGPGIRKGKNTREYEGSFCSAYIGGCAAGNVLWADGRAVAPELRGRGGGGARQGERVAIHEGIHESVVALRSLGDVLWPRGCGA